MSKIIKSFMLLILIILVLSLNNLAFAVDASSLSLGSQANAGTDIGTGDVGPKFYYFGVDNTGNSTALSVRFWMAGPANVYGDYFAATADFKYPVPAGELGVFIYCIGSDSAEQGEGSSREISALVYATINTSSYTISSYKVVCIMGMGTHVATDGTTCSCNSSLNGYGDNRKYRFPRHGGMGTDDEWPLKISANSYAAIHKGGWTECAGSKSLGGIKLTTRVASACDVGTAGLAAANDAVWMSNKCTNVSYGCYQSASGASYRPYIRTHGYIQHYEYSEHTHSWSWTWNATQHYQVCSCGATQNAANHTWPTTWAKDDDDYHTQVCSHSKCGADRKAKHTWVWTNNATKHWQKCSASGCDAKKDEANHTPSAYQTDATQHWTVCTNTNCNRELTRGDHTWPTTWAKKDDSYHNQYCSTCQRERTATHTWAWTNDANKHWQKCTASGCDAKKDEANHTASAWQTNDTQHWQYCTNTNCNRELTRGNHSWSWTWDGSNHWQECSTCHKKKDSGAHTMAWTWDGTNHWRYCTHANCNYTDSSAAHTWAWTSDATNHWQYCSHSSCGATQSMAAHYDNVYNTRATFGVCDLAGCSRRLYWPTSTVPTANTGLFYNGDEQTGVNLPREQDPSPATGFTITNNIKRDAGTYTATLTLSSGYRWWPDKGTAATKTISWTIDKATTCIVVPNTTSQRKDAFGNVIGNSVETIRYGGNEKSFTATVKTNCPKGCAGTLTASSSNTSYISISAGASTSVTATTSGVGTTIKYKGGTANKSVVNISFTFTPTDTNNFYSSSTAPVPASGTYKSSSPYTVVCIDDIAPTGSFKVSSLHNVLNNGTVAVKARAVTFSISYADAGSSMDKIALIEKPSIGNNRNATLGAVTWEAPATSKSFTLSTGDGLKTVYLLLRDTWGNITVVPTK